MNTSLPSSARGQVSSDTPLPTDSPPVKTDITFGDLAIDNQLLQILKKRSIINPTPIQEQGIPVALEGDDMIGIAQTGTGKTLAFVLPMMQKLLANRQQALILVPTRELAYQVDEVCQWFSKQLKVFSTVIIGGASMTRQLAELKRNPQIIIATPGRLIDHLQQKTINLSKVNYLVLDEADRMFDMGFAPQIRSILKVLPDVSERQTLLFSATMPEAIATLVTKYMQSPLRVEIAASGNTAKDVHQEMIIIDKEHQKPALFSVLSKISGAAIIFSRTKHQASKLVKDMRNKGYRAEELHSNRSLAQRTRALAAIQSRKSQFLVATDIAARGIDISHIEIVINFDLPENPEDYVHRIGRTGRAGRKGKAISFVLSDQRGEIRRIQKFINKEIIQIHLDEVPSAQLQDDKKLAFSSKGRSSGNRSGRPRKFSGGSRKFSNNRRTRRS